MTPAESLDELRGRIARVVPEVTRLCEIGLELPRAVSARAFAVTGIGGSEGPARLLVASLLRAGLAARFVPLSAFAAGESIARPGEALCVFSHGLSPNARIALARAREHDVAVLFTAKVDAPAARRFRDEGGVVVPVPGPVESGTLLRVVAPALGLTAAALFAGIAAGAPISPALLSALPRALERASERGRAAAAALDARLDAPIALVTVGQDALADGLPLKWSEALGGPEPPIWDVLSIAHGPFHAFYMEPRTLVALGQEGPLLGRLAAMLAPERHALVALAPTLPFPLSRLEAEAGANELVLAALARRPRDLSSWPSAGLDAPLYELSEPPARGA